MSYVALPTATRLWTRSTAMIQRHSYLTLYVFVSRIARASHSRRRNTQELGDIHGFDVARAIRKNEAILNSGEQVERSPTGRRLSVSSVHLPIVMVSAHTEEEFRVKALQAGCDFCIGKPINRERLLQCLSDVARLKASATSPLARLHVCASTPVRFAYTASGFLP